MSTSSRRLVFLVGFMGSGKSTLGPLLAARLGVPYLDLDDAIERAAGRPVRALFEDEGEAGFRARERAALDRAIAGLATSGGVVATGGGLFADPDNRARIARTGGVSLWLDAPLAAIRARVPRDGTRPLFGDEAQLTALFEHRRAHYALADARIDATDAAPGTLLARALAALASAGPAPSGGSSTP